MTHGIPAESKRASRRIPVATLFVAVLLVIYWVALFYGTHTKIPPGILPGNSDKLIHFGAYAGLGFLLMTLRSTRGVYPWFSVVARWFVLACYGAFDELTQLLVNRDAEWLDWTADMIGAAVGIGFVNFGFWFVRRRIKPCDESSPVEMVIPN